jgi:hypothetical protein
MKFDTKTLGLIQLTLIISTYLGTSFVQWEFNAGAWSKDVRIAFLGALFVTSFFVHMTRAMIHDTNKK